MASPVIVKFPGESRTVNIDFVNELVGGEVITAGTVSTSSPSGLTVSTAATVGSIIPLTVGGGADAQSYGVNVTVNTSQGHTYTIRVAVVNNSQLAANYQNVNVDAFNQLMGEIEAGEAALGKCGFMFPAGFDAAGGQVQWSLLDQDGVVLASGTAFDYQSNAVTNGVKVEAQAVVSVPSETLPTLSGQSYQIRWALTINGQTQYNFETLRVTAANTVPEGVEDVIELADQDIPVSCMFSQPFDQVFVTVYRNNDAITQPIPAGRAIRTADGYLYQVTLVGVEAMARLEAYTLMWSAKNHNNPYTERQTGRMFIVNPMIMSALNDMRATINKSRTTINGAPDLIFHDALLLAYLRRGRDDFNGAYGVMTDFTMESAQGPIRDYWLRYAEIAALRAQYLAEGEKVFNYSGAAVSLDVDRTQFYDTMASNMQARIDQEVKPFKQMLIKRGIMGGDGNITNLTKQRPGAAGALGITISPASNFGPYARYRR